MSRRVPTAAARTPLVLPAGLALAFLSGCGYGQWNSSDGDVRGRNVALAAFAAEESDLPSRTISRTVAPPADGAPLRVFSAAGGVSLVLGEDDDFVLTATVYAGAFAPHEAERLLDAAEWTTTTDRHAERFHHVDFGPGAPAKVHYPGLRHGEVTAELGPRRWTIVADRSAGAPTLFAKLRVSVPRGASIEVRDVLGGVTGAELEGSMWIDTSWADVTLGGVSGELRVDTGSGDVEIGRAAGRVVVDTASGDVVIEQLDGNGSIDTSSGDIEIGQIDADRALFDTASGDVLIRRGTAQTIHADTASGEIELHDVDVRDFHGDTSSGDITISGPFTRAAHVVADTGSGDVTIHLGPETSFRLHASTGSGDVEVDVAGARVLRDDDEVVGASRGDGAVEIHVDTGSGDCRIVPRAP